MDSMPPPNALAKISWSIMIVDWGHPWRYRRSRLILVKGFFGCSLYEIMGFSIHHWFFVIYLSPSSSIFIIGKKRMWYNSLTSPYTRNLMNKLIQKNKILEVEICVYRGRKIIWHGICLLHRHSLALYW